MSSSEKPSPLNRLLLVASFAIWCLAFLLRNASVTDSVLAVALIVAGFAVFLFPGIKDIPNKAWFQSSITTAIISISLGAGLMMTISSPNPETSDPPMAITQFAVTQVVENRVTATTATPASSTLPTNAPTNAIQGATNDAGFTERVITVQANQEAGIPTNIPVKKGDILRFTATGTWCWGPGPDECSDANGTPGRPVLNELPVTLNGERFGKLIGRVEDWFFPIGMENETTMTADGELFLLMNDRVGAYADNSKTVIVNITVVH